MKEDLEIPWKRMVRSVDGRVGCEVGWVDSHKLLSPFDGIGNHPEMAQRPRPTSVIARIHFCDFDIKVPAGLQTLHLDSVLFVFESDSASCRLALNWLCSQV